MKIISWNVNSVKARIEHLVRYLKDTSPDVVLLQELKCVDEAFPAMEIEDLGYNIAIHGQKTYNGVAILSKFRIEDVYKELDISQARYIEAVTNGVRVASVYVPNGQEVGSDKFKYKMQFFSNLHAHLQSLLQYDEKIVIGGDFNVAPTDIDVFDPKSLAGSICFHPDEQAAFRAMLNMGYIDSFRARNADKQLFSWWDYRAGAYQYNKGMRIDHILLNPEAADNLLNSGIDPTPRGWEKPSDHTPVWVEIK
jgi:exodeoxyribonuclease-3